jgi:hypothetical protein
MAPKLSTEKVIAALKSDDLVKVKVISDTLVHAIRSGDIVGCSKWSLEEDWNSGDNDFLKTVYEVGHLAS